MIIDEKNIGLLSKTAEPDERALRAILKEAAKGKGLGLEEASSLLAVRDAAMLYELFKAAGELKERVFGKRISALTAANTAGSGPRTKMSPEEPFQSMRPLPRQRH